MNRYTIHMKKAGIAAFFTGVAVLALSLVISMVFSDDPIHRSLHVISTVLVTSCLAYNVYLELTERKLINSGQCVVIGSGRPGEQFVLLMSLILAVFLLIYPVFRAGVLNVYAPITIIAIACPFCMRTTRNRIIIAEEYVVLKDIFVNKPYILGYVRDQNTNCLMISCRDGKKFSVRIEPGEVAKLEESNICQVVH